MDLGMRNGEGDLEFTNSLLDGEFITYFIKLLISPSAESNTYNLLL